ncbi:hypothetical protein B0H19DRAFT_1138330 [Mycena capillaripes]|nr:hypothetical protein B0H19DRAFT_1138330 [Mycena capillaripes]
MLKCLDKLSDRTSWSVNAKEQATWATIYLALARKSEHLTHTYQSLLFVGDACMNEGDHTTALSMFHTVLEGSKEMKVSHRQAICLSRIGDVWNTQGNRAEAEIYWTKAQHVYSDVSVRDGIIKMDTARSNRTD